MAKTIVKNLSRHFQVGKADFDTAQSYIFLDAAHAISIWMESGDRAFLEWVYQTVIKRTSRFNSADEFADYYISLARQTIETVRSNFSEYPDLLEQYNAIFQR